MPHTKSTWAPNLFKGRIGEAIVESVLAEFGYRVQRAGFEQVGAPNDRLRPDLLVAHSTTPDEARYVEVKYRSARPTSVQLDPGRLKMLSLQYPETIFAFASAYDGGIYCAHVRDLTGSTDRFVNLLDPIWKPVSHYFEHVTHGERLQNLWSKMQVTLHSYGARTVSGRVDQTLWDGEYAALARLLDESWTGDLEQFGLRRGGVELLNLEQQWDRFRRQIAARAVMDLIGDNELPIPTLMTLFARMQGNRGERTLFFDLEELAADLGIDLLAAEGIGTLMSAAIKSRNNPATMKLMDRLLRDLPDGVGTILLMDPSLPPEDAETVDLRTALMFASSASRLDR
ncbi:MAG: hypothetical protein O3B84_04505 [Chloroflexi bacterium]|nr:hypothetical protein [Chloroflexota bacterium]